MIDTEAIEVAAEWAVPSERQVEIGRWRAHLSSGHIRRINAVTLHGERPDESVVRDRIAFLQDLYRDCGLRPRLRTTSMDAWIDPMISKWSESGEALVMTVDSRPADVGSTISIEGWLEWMETRAISSGRFDEAAASARRLAADNVVVTVAVDGEIIAAARAVSTNGLTGLFDISVDPDHRRRGHARAMIERLRGWAADRNELVYLQVAAVNTPAIGLYRTEGFTERYRYRYRSPD